MKLASFSFLLGVMSAILILPSFSHAESKNKETVSVVVLESLTYYEKNGEITAKTNLKNDTVIVRQKNETFVTVKI